MAETTNNSFSYLLPPRICALYSHFELTSEGSYYKTLSAKSRVNKKNYSIRVLDTASELLKKQRDPTITLFFQEILYFTLRTRQNDVIIIEDFEVFEDKIAFVTTPCIVLSKIKGTTAVNLEKMLRDTISDLAFLQTKMKISDLSLNPSSICYSNELFSYFIGDWNQGIKGEQENQLDDLEANREFETVLKIWESNEECFEVSAETANQLNSLASIVLELCGLEQEEWKGLANAKNKNSYFSMTDEICKTLEKLKQPLRVQKVISKMLKSSFYAKPKRKQHNPLGIATFVGSNPQQGMSMEFEFPQSLPSGIAWCSRQSNFVSLGDLQTKTVSENVQGAKIKNYQDAYTLLDHLPESDLLISTIMNLGTADFEIIDCSKNMQKVYHFGARAGRIWDISTNVKTRLAAIPSLEGAVSHYLFDWTSLKIVRRAKWPKALDGCIEGIDFNADGKLVSVLDSCGKLLVSNVMDDKVVFNIQTTENLNESLNRCRWNPNTPQIAVKIDFNKINLIDAERFVKLYKNQVSLDELRNGIPWIDWRSDGNLLACASDGGDVKIFDQRQGSIVKTFQNLHSDGVRCVKWSPCRNYIASSSADSTIKLISLETGEVVYSERTFDGDWASSVCFI